MNGDQYQLGQIPGQPAPYGGTRLTEMTGPPPPQQPGLTAPGQSYGEQSRALWSAADELQRQRQQQAAAHLQRVRAGQSAALAGQQLAGGGLQQQQMAARARGPLMQRAAIYGQARAADEMLAQAAQRRAQEQLAAQALLQETYGAEAAQRMAQAQQLLQSYGMSREQAAARQAAAAQAEAAEQQMIQNLAMGAIGAGSSAMAASDRRLKQGIRRPRSVWEQELYQALRGGDR
jgi:hypothetical protein